MSLRDALRIPASQITDESVYRDRRRLLQAFDDHLNEACVGSISEVFDAMAPHTPRGCVAQAWSVAEVLRTLVRLQST